MADEVIPDNPEDISKIAHESQDVQSDEEIEHKQDASEFAFKLVNSVKSMNTGEISYHELAMSFTIADELKCLFLFTCHITIPNVHYHPPPGSGRGM